MTKHYSSGSEMNQKILNGINILADNVASTLGPRGRNVILQESKKRPIITKDGVTVANFVDLNGIQTFGHLTQEISCSNVKDIIENPFTFCFSYSQFFSTLTISFQ